MAQGTMSRSEMEATIRSGWSVIHNGVLHSTLGTLPTEEELAAGDPAAEAAVKADLQRRVDELQARLPNVQGGQQQAADATAGDAPADGEKADDKGIPPHVARFQELEALPVAELRAVAVERGVSTSGTKNELLTNIVNAEFPEE